MEGSGNSVKTATSSSLLSVEELPVPTSAKCSPVHHISHDPQHSTPPIQRDCVSLVVSPTFDRVSDQQESIDDHMRIADKVNNDKMFTIYGSVEHSMLEDCSVCLPSEGSLQALETVFH